MVTLFVANGAFNLHEAYYQMWFGTGTYDAGTDDNLTRAFNEFRNPSGANYMKLGVHNPLYTGDGNDFGDRLDFYKQYSIRSTVSDKADVGIPCSPSTPQYLCDMSYPRYTSAVNSILNWANDHYGREQSWHNYASWRDHASYYKIEGLTDISIGSWFGFIFIYPVLCTYLAVNAFELAVYFVMRLTSISFIWWNYWFCDEDVVRMHNPQ